MQKIHDIKLNGGDTVYCIKELTVRDTYSWFEREQAAIEERAKQAADAGEEAIPPPLPMRQVFNMFYTAHGVRLDWLEVMLTEPGEKTVDDLTSPELKKLISKCKEVNPDFFELASSVYPTMSATTG